MPIQKSGKRRELLLDWIPMTEAMQFLRIVPFEVSLAAPQVSHPAVPQDPQI
jgi:hypothetical protein